jgi:ABC-type Na+ efflux pump permease subunit
MHTGDTVSIRVVYLTTETSGTSQVTQDTILGIPLYMLIFIILIMFGGIAAVLYLSKKPGRKEAGKLMGQLVIATGVIAALIMFVLSTVGLIHV